MFVGKTKFAREMVQVRSSDVLFVWKAVREGDRSQVNQLFNFPQKSIVVRCVRDDYRLQTAQRMNSWKATDSI